VAVLFETDILLSNDLLTELERVAKLRIVMRPEKLTFIISYHLEIEAVEYLEYILSE
jgi:hypothetical protein